MASVLLGVLLTVAGAATLALAMVLQRYALSYPDKRVPFMGLKWPRLLLWLVGLLTYAAANGFYAAALNFGPLSLLACVFTLLLVFNLVFARLLLGEVLTPPKIVGCLAILVGVCLCVIGAARDAPTEFTPNDIEDLLGRVAGAVYFGIILSIVFASIGAIIWYEKRYPTVPGSQSLDASRPESSSVTASVGTGNGVSLPDSGQLCDAGAAQRPKADSDSAIGVPTSSSTSPTSETPLSRPAKDVETQQCEGKRARVGPPSSKKPPRRLDQLMSVVYPGSLGLDEGIAHLTMKGTLAMLSDCGLCNHWAFYLFLALWISASVATAGWLKVVFARFETTSALPVEYGMVNLASVCSGLIFYNESKYMETWQIVCSIIGLAVILCGIQCSISPALPCGRRSESASESPQ